MAWMATCTIMSITHSLWRSWSPWLSPPPHHHHHHHHHRHHQHPLPGFWFSRSALAVLHHAASYLHLGRVRQDRCQQRPERCTCGCIICSASGTRGKTEGGGNYWVAAPKIVETIQFQGLRLYCMIQLVNFSIAGCVGSGLFQVQWWHGSRPWLQVGLKIFGVLVSVGSALAGLESWPMA